MKHTPGLWKYEKQQTPFTLVVEDFGICYFNRSNKQHMINTLKAENLVKLVNRSK